MSLRPACPIDLDQAADALRSIQADSLIEFSGALPPTALALIDSIGALAACKLFNALSGVQTTIPSSIQQLGVAGSRCRLIEDLIGGDALAALVGSHGGTTLEVPVCTELRQAQAKKWVTATFDGLTGPPYRLTKSAAVLEIGSACGVVGVPLTYRTLERWIDSL